VTQLRLATFNLLHGLSLEHGDVREGDLRSVAKTLDADIVGLQEVDRGQARSYGVDQTAVVADALEAPYARFVPALHGTPGAQRTWRAASEEDGSIISTPTYGVGLVSRWPVLAWHVLRFAPAPVPLPLLMPSKPPRLRLTPDEPRVALLAVVDGPSGPFTVVTAHLSFVPGFNGVQLRRIVRWAGRFPAPRLLAGDLNLPGPVPHVVTRWQRLARVATYPSYRPRVQFDHVLASGVPEGAVRDVRVLTLPVSDHCALSVDVEVE
jgi:endonuclease/exonuclease/phosphatase family metal-dependent hydrolase